jgi:hypothetical protein
MTLSYHARQDLTQIQLAAYEESARSQEADILLFMKHHPGTDFTAENLPYYLTPLKNVPVTSIRRALTNLSNGGQISKTGQVQGQHRRPINTYRYGVISHV